MDKIKALIAVVAFAAGAGAGTAISQPAKPDVQIVNLKLVRSELPDGGPQWTGRACAYEKRDGQLTEPCWSTPVTTAAVALIERQLLDARK